MHHTGKSWISNPMFDLHLSFLEVQAAKAVFLRCLRHFAPFARRPKGTPGYMSPETAVSCALAEVWRQGRKYQRDQDRAALFELSRMEAWV